MAKVKGPMFSVVASGSYGDIIEFMKWKRSSFRRDFERSGTGYVRARGFPTVPNTGAVVSMRRTFRAGVSIYQDDSQCGPDARMSWDVAASGTGMSGFNRYLQAFVDYNPQRSAPWNVPEPV